MTAMKVKYVQKAQKCSICTIVCEAVEAAKLFVLMSPYYKETIKSFYTPP